MGYADTLLSNGERITLRSRQHWLATVLESRWAILAVIAAIVLFLIGNGPLGGTRPGEIADGLRWALGIVTLVLVLGALAWVALVLLNWNNEEYIVTNRRVMKVEGLLNKHAADSSLEKINDAVLDQNVIGRMLNFGDLDIITANESEVDKFRMLARPIAFKKEILNQKHDLEFEQMRPPVSPPLRAPAPAAAMPAAPMTMGGETVPSMGGSPSSAGAPAARSMTPAEVTQTLAGLADLRDRGAITPAEFEAKKAELLGRL